MFNITRSGLDAIGKELGVISNNIANSNKMHLKEAGQSLLIFTLRPSRHLQIKSGRSYVTGTQKIMKQGSPILTGSALDLTISGKGFVLSPREDADPRFTRWLCFSLDATGNLVTTGI